MSSAPSPPPLQQPHVLENVALLARLIPFAATNFRRTIELAFVSLAFNDCVVNYQESTFARLMRNASDSNGLRAIVPYACGRGYVELARATAMHRCTVTIADASGWSGLHHAVFRQRVDVVRLLVSSPVLHVNHRNNMGWTPLRCAVYPLGRPALEIIDVLCTAKRGTIDLNAVCNDGWTPLIAATQCKRPDLCAALLERGAAVDVKVPKTGYTALVMAIVYHSPECAEVLLRAGRASLTTQLVETGRTPLLVAIAGPSPHGGAGGRAAIFDEAIAVMILEAMHERYEDPQQGGGGNRERVREVLRESRDDRGRNAADMVGTGGSPRLRELLFLE
jgi:hypothetical protein